MKDFLVFSIVTTFLISFTVTAQDNFVYKESFPPKLVSVDLASFEVSDQAFPFYDGSLLVPDSISLKYFREKIVLEVVQGNEEESFEPLASFDFEDTYLLKAGNYKITGDEVPDVDRNREISTYLFFKQRIWIKGLLYAAREYEAEKNRKFRVDGFRVEFREVGDLIRPSVILYSKKAEEDPEKIFKPVTDAIENIEEQLRDIEDTRAGANEKLDDLHSLGKSILNKLNEISASLKGVIKTRNQSQ